ncbi:(d)CMP kinase [Anaerovoracaceae bacterium 41-7]|jgi:cytidylate kinase|uniref:Cytidylate kinase n=1 Tax=Anaerotruncus colihominis TaxID=169435 RepID=A0A845QIU1_9FIRM|nr:MULTISPECIES: (d)CMP kinase [Clostridia]MCI9475574.1 (d)CMP kinase [Emergencia sp.]MCI9639706.1 (d)CMP kinase [Emergencia sp.]NBH61021.1 (d)CMP kinase [Anaerotruncus colihominis]NCE98543.1 (d)CMP kinase [Emergencia sp. 1XD21-10]NCF01676.1 (d)CMP kinase [Anaerotruncus sp. 80]
MKEIIRIAVDGPSGAGKSTIAKAIAKKLCIDYIDTGAMYRAVGYKMLQKGIAMDDIPAITEMLKETEIDFSSGNIYLDGENINDRIRTEEISKQASDCSALGIVRAKLTEQQQKMGEKKSVIMDGRDIGTVVFPDAEYKFYITATAEERANRRFKELIAKGEEVTYEKVLADIKQRDHNDSTREINPLRKADDALELDTTEMKIEEVIDFISKEMNK